MDKTVFCTIFTPAYNRKDLLMRLYRSLQEQTDKDFEWIIVDDGSTDGTDDAVKQLKEESFVISYKKVTNGGKHRAINHGVAMANGRVFAIVDSDDFLLPNAVETLKKYFEDISGTNKKFAGVAAQRCYSGLQPIGSSFQGEYVDATAIERKKYNILGDKFEVFYTDVMRKFPFPEVEGEKFMTEAVVWNRIAADGYVVRWFNDCLYVCDYLEGGLTDTRDSLIQRSPMGYALFIRERVQIGDISLKEILGYYSYYFKLRKHYARLGEISKELDANAFVILGAYLIRCIVDWIRILK